LKMVSDHIFTRYRGNALTSDACVDFINENEIDEFYITGADAVACVKSTCYNMCKAGFTSPLIVSLTRVNLQSTYQHVIIDV